MADSAPAILQTVLDCGPVGVMAREFGLPVWANRTLLAWAGLSADEFLGMASAAAPDPRCAALLGSDAIFPLRDATGDPRWLKRLSCQGIPPPQQWEYFLDITREQMLAREIDALEVRDPATGVLNRRGILAMLDKQVTRTRRYGNPLSLVCVALPRGHADMHCVAWVRELRDRLRWVDEIGRLDAAHVLLILPETDEANAARLMAKLRTEQVGPLRSQAGGMVAVTAWRKGDDQRRLLERLGWPSPLAP